MAREHRAARKSGPRTNLYDDITDKIIAEAAACGRAAAAKAA